MRFSPFTTYSSVRFPSLNMLGFGSLPNIISKTLLQSYFLVSYVSFPIGSPPEAIHQSAVCLCLCSFKYTPGKTQFFAMGVFINCYFQDKGFNAITCNSYANSQFVSQQMQPLSAGFKFVTNDLFIRSFKNCSTSTM